ncbi:hypothetical protein IV203_013962 [Nitzschia inconspicua]|uniref:Uncharacterized protein n=1 Tax=Nitzschia inconspicua TaxID=303405 RepID=A0A9K3M6F9_9STRA|nr:hypothetical protein IV203_013962 [Nitzschia inconspicua]
MEKIVCLDTDQNAWNIDGSASDRPPYQSSWIREWEEATDQARGYCSYVGCKNMAVDGGHVWISRLKSVYIAPICKKCNYYENTRRQQGSKSKIRRGTTLLQRPYTSDMLNAPRRISSCVQSRNCQECGQSISGAPKNHLFCSDCFMSEIPRVVTHPTSPARRCQGCSSDISDRPPTHQLCYDCFQRSESIDSNRSAKRQRRQCECCGGKCISCSPPKYMAIPPVVAHPSSPTRRCQSCRSDISDRPPSHQLCYDCFQRSESRVTNVSANRHRRRCECCGECISDSPPNHTMCYDCFKKDEPDEDESDEDESDEDESDEGEPDENESDEDESDENESYESD